MFIDAKCGVFGTVLQNAYAVVSAHRGMSPSKCSQKEIGGYTDGFGWEAVADIKLVVTGMDVIARSDGRFQEGFPPRESIEPYEDAWLCRFVLSNDELVFVAGREGCLRFPWISLVDIWSMSVLFVLDSRGDIGNYKKFGAWCLAANGSSPWQPAIENHLVVVANDQELVGQPRVNLFFEIMVWELQ
ncbi:hypothetical protein FOZ63_023943 [Perkinsus olseni]|uniref:Uncharacterized protein n=1 Tax=Perkinsus olseni TaxID=32597 RepID=A0A7J6SVT3_PEROL|nr:hypothetical protein FOZ63_023943 [Perkinsus olseni]KAF4736236.1 hypothetical protein FOZ62_009093 [Perkinsus olseni]